MREKLAEQMRGWETKHEEIKRGLQAFVAEAREAAGRYANEATEQLRREAEAWNAEHVAFKNGLEDVSAAARTRFANEMIIARDGAYRASPSLGGSAGRAPPRHRRSRDKDARKRCQRDDGGAPCARSASERLDDEQRTRTEDLTKIAADMRKGMQAEMTAAREGLLKESSTWEQMHSDYREDLVQLATDTRKSVLEEMSTAYDGVLKEAEAWKNAQANYREEIEKLAAEARQKVLR